MNYRPLTLAVAMVLSMNIHATAADRQKVGGIEVGAVVDESPFAPGGDGVTLHVAPRGNDKQAGDDHGSAASPFATVEAAVAAANRLQYGLVTAQTPASAGDVRLPCWFRIERKGDVVRSFVRFGDTGEWKPAGPETTLAMDAAARVGLFVNNETRKGDASATFDNITINGTPATGAWQAAKQYTVLINAGGGSFNVADGAVTVLGRGAEAKGDHVIGENGMFVHQPLEGDGEIVARLSSLALVPDDKKKFYGTAGLVLSDTTETNSRMVRIAVSGNGAAAADTPSRVMQSTRTDGRVPAKAVKVSIAPGTYRLKAALTLTGADAAGRAEPIVIEGTTTGDGRDVILSGSETTGWEPSTWTLVDAGKNIYSHAWTNNWGFNPNAWSSPLSRRREMVFINGKRLEQKLIEEFTADRPKPLTYKGFRDPVEHLPEGAFGIAEFGPGDPPAAIVNTSEGKKTFAALHAADAAHSAVADQIFIRLPAGMTPEQFASATVEVSVTGRALHVDNRDNFVLRNVTVQHFSDGLGALITDTNNNWSPRPMGPNRNWILENVHIDDNRGIGAQLWWVDGLTIKNSTFDRNGDYGTWMLGERIDVSDVSNSNNNWAGALPMNWLVRNSRFEKFYCNNNGAFGLRMDHLGENVEFIDSQFNGNKNPGTMFETTIGPVTFRRCEFKDNLPSKGNDHNAGIILSTAHNVTFDGCTFANNGDMAMMIYPRERAHLAVVKGQDEMPNNLDEGKFSTYRDETANLAEPGKQKPANEIRNLTIINCTFTATGAKDRFYDQSKYKRNEAYGRAIGEEMIAYNNTYWHPANPTPFMLPFNKPGTFEQWRQQAGRADFEAGSHFGEGPNPNPPYVPPAASIATTVDNTQPDTAEQGVLRYEAENTKFTATQPVESIGTPGGGRAHKLKSINIGDRGDAIEYTLNVPQGGEYHVNVRYLQDGGPRKYLGYAQLKIDGRVQGRWWDQHGLTTQSMDVPLESVRLTAGEHKFRFEPVWRNGYGSASYDITIDRIELHTTQPLIAPSAPAASNGSGLSYAVYEIGEFSTRLPDFAKLTPMKTGVAPGFDVAAVRTRDKGYAVVFTGVLDVPADGLYTLLTTVNDGANLYLNDQLVLDNDGVHDGEKNQPWQKQSRVALKAGRHALRVEYFNASGTTGSLAVLWDGPGIDRQPIGSERLSR